VSHRIPWPVCLLLVLLPVVSSVTDTSAATTPTHGAYAPNPHALAALSSSALGLGGSRGTSPDLAGGSTYAPIRRSKDKQKHSESENRRRQRLRAKFTALQVAAGVNGKKDRYSILGQAVEKLKEYENRISRVEQEKAALTAQLAQNTLASGVGSPQNTPAGTPPLSTPLSHFQMLANVAVCYISLDGRILDANGAFVNLFAFTGANAQAAAGGAGAGGDTDMTSGSQPAADIYTSSIFALTHHQELIHTLSILRNLLCGVMASYECTKRCLDMRGQMLECAMTITSVMNAGKIVMFLCVFVPKGNGGISSGSVQQQRDHGGPQPMTDTVPSSQSTNPYPSSSSSSSVNGLNQPQNSQLSSPSAMFPPPQHASPTNPHRSMILSGSSGMSASSPSGPIPFSPTHRVYGTRPPNVPVYGGPSSSTGSTMSAPQQPMMMGSASSMMNNSMSSSLQGSTSLPAQSASSTAQDDATVASMLASSPIANQQSEQPAAATTAPPSSSRGRTSPISFRAPPSLQSTSSAHIPTSGRSAAASGRMSDQGDVAVANSFLDLASPSTSLSQQTLTSSSSGALPARLSALSTPPSASSDLPTLDRPLSDIGSMQGTPLDRPMSEPGGGQGTPSLTAGDLQRITSNNSVSGFMLSPTGSTSQFLAETPPA
jgi:hypothetical protein